jgi:cytochrome c
LRKTRTRDHSAFERDCAICHDVTVGKNRIGPSLFGIVGRAAGTVPNLDYSEANKGSALTWDAATLDRYLISLRTAYLAILR